MRPPFELNSKILQLCTEITRFLGRLEGLQIAKPEPQLRRSNRVKTIQASLAIEGNTLLIDQVTALFEGKRVLGSKREILEVQNAIRAYDKIKNYDPYSAKSLREAHGILMKNLVEDAGKWRANNVGIFRGEKVTHAAPQAKRVPELMDQLFEFLKNDEKETHPLILSAVFHYELEFIHPFSDGNGRIGRLWQTALLTKFHSLFEYTPIESVIRNRQEAYYDALGLADKAGEATVFVEFSLETVLEALEELSSSIRPTSLNGEDRLEIAREKFGSHSFSRKAYLAIFKTISTATASRDLARGVQNGMIARSGEKSLTVYRFK